VGFNPDQPSWKDDSLKQEEEEQKDSLFTTIWYQFKRHKFDT
jgi:hypothetical protein